MKPLKLPTSISLVLFNIFLCSNISMAEVKTMEAVMNADSDANLVIYRSSPKNQFLSQLNYRILVDGRMVGKLKINTHHALTLSPGYHTIIVSDHAHSKIKVSVTENATTIVKGVTQRDLTLKLDAVNTSEAITDFPVITKYLSDRETQLVSHRIE